MERNKIEKEYMLITSVNFPKGGAGATYLNLLCRGLNINGCKIRVLLLKGFAFGHYKNYDSKNNITEYGIPYRYLGFTKRPKNILLKILEDLKSFLNLIAFLFSILNKRKSISLLVYTDEIQANILIYLMSLIFKIRVITFVAEYYDKSDFRSSIFRKLRWLGFIFNFNHLIKLSDKLVVFSHFLRDEYIKKGFNEANIIIQPNLTDFDYWITNDSKVKYTLGYSGTPTIKDGLYDLFKAINLLQNEGIHVSLLVIGDSAFGRSFIPELETECKKLGIEGKITFTGLVETSMVKQYLSECSILAITRPSTTQTKAGFPTKLGEYFAVQRPILATNFGDIEKYFKNRVDLIIAESGNPESIALNIKWMLQNNDILNSISNRGYNRAKDLLDYNSSVKRMIELIN
jgi:glycosyltransferase involved in cell wall biosynthesis